MKSKILGVLLLALLSACQSEIPSKTILISNSGENSVGKFDFSTGKYLGYFISEGEGGLHYPDAITKLEDGSLIVSSGCRATPDSICEKATSAVLKYNAQTGASEGVFASVESSELLYRPYGTKISKDGLVYVASFVGNALLRYDQKGKFLDVFAQSDGKDSLGLNGPNGIAFDKDGSHLFVTTEGSTYVCDSLALNNCKVEFTGFPSLILKYNLSNRSSKVFTIPAITDPNNPPSLAGILLAPNGKLFVSDFTMNLIRVYDPDSGKEERTIPIDLGTSCNTTGISDQYIGDIVLDDDGSILISVGGYSDSDPGGVVRLLAPNYEETDCIVAPTSDMNRPIGINIISGN